MALVVELAGIPGSGKSTLAGLVIDELNRADRVVHHSERLSLVSKLGSAWNYRGLQLIVLRVLVRSPRSMSEKLAALKFIAVTLARYRVAFADDSEDIYLFDEGTLQRTFMLFVEASGVAEAELVDYVERVPVADVIVHLDVAPAEALRRIEGRDRQLPERIRNLGSAALNELLEGANGLLRSACELAAALPPRTGRGQREVLGLSDSRDAEHLVAALLGFSGAVRPDSNA